MSNEGGAAHGVEGPGKLVTLFMRLGGSRLNEQLPLNTDRGPSEALVLGKIVETSVYAFQ